MFSAICMKSCSLSERTWTEATILFSDNCQTCSSCKETTPETFRIDDLTSSRETAAGTP